MENTGGQGFSFQNMKDNWPVFLSGFSFSFVFFLLLIIFSPTLLITQYSPEQVDGILLEIPEIPSQKKLLSLYNLFRKKKARKVFLLFHESFEVENKVGLQENYQEAFLRYFLRRGILPEYIDLMTVPKQKEFSPASNARHMARLLVARNIKSIILLTETFDSRLHLNAYTEVLSPLKILVYVSIYPEPFNSSNWFQTSRGFSHVFGKFLQYIFS